MKNKPYKDPIGYLKYVLSALAIIILVLAFLVSTVGCSTPKDGCTYNKGFTGYGLQKRARF